MSQPETWYSLILAMHLKNLVTQMQLPELPGPIWLTSNDAVMSRDFDSLQLIGGRAKTRVFTFFYD